MESSITDTNFRNQTIPEIISIDYSKTMKCTCSENQIMQEKSTPLFQYFKQPLFKRKN